MRMLQRMNKGSSLSSLYKLSLELLKARQEFSALRNGCLSARDESGCTVGTFRLGDTTAGTDPHPGELATATACLPESEHPMRFDTDVTVVHRWVSQPMRTEVNNISWRKLMPAAVEPAA